MKLVRNLGKAASVERVGMKSRLAGAEEKTGGEESETV